MRRRSDESAASREAPRRGPPRPEAPRQEKARQEKPRGEKPRPEKPRFPRPGAGKARAQEAGGESRAKTFEGERVAKAMARVGVCSRRDAEQWIMDGRVAVNGRKLASPAFNVREGDEITLDGAPLAERERTRLFLFHKPGGLVTSAKDPEGRDTVFSYLAQRHADLPRVVSVGRLDINTEGLLLLTNDGGLARVLELPATGWTRRYRVRAHGEVDQAMLETLAKGVTIDEVSYAPIEARLDRVQGANAWITMSLSEGKNREIKRVLEHLRLDVTRLIRISYGPFQLGEIAEGAVEEVKLKVLREQLGKGLAELAGVDFSSPLRETPSAKEAQEARERADNRPRKHVSAMRKQRVDRGEDAPRARIERAVTADRKGRAVAVERVIVKGEKPAAESRNARRFDALRRQDARPSRGEGRFAPKREDGGRFERNASAAKPSREGGKFDRNRGQEQTKERGAGGRTRPEGDTRPPRARPNEAKKFDAPRRPGGGERKGPGGKPRGPGTPGGRPQSRNPRGPR